MGVGDATFIDGKRHVFSVGRFRAGMSALAAQAVAMVRRRAAGPA